MSGCDWLIWLVLALRWESLNSLWICGGWIKGEAEIAIRSCPYPDRCVPRICMASPDKLSGKWVQWVSKILGHGTVTMIWGHLYFQIKNSYTGILCDGFRSGGKQDNQKSPGTQHNMEVYCLVAAWGFCICEALSITTGVSKSARSSWPSCLLPSVASSMRSHFFLVSDLSPSLWAPCDSYKMSRRHQPVHLHQDQRRASFFTFHF